jgi:hypothetical protein
MNELDTLIEEEPAAGTDRARPSLAEAKAALVEETTGDGG